MRCSDGRHVYMVFLESWSEADMVSMLWVCTPSRNLQLLQLVGGMPAIFCEYLYKLVVYFIFKILVF